MRSTNRKDLGKHQVFRHAAGGEIQVQAAVPNKPCRFIQRPDRSVGQSSRPPTTSVLFQQAPGSGNEQHSRHHAGKWAFQQVPKNSGPEGPDQILSCRSSFQNTKTIGTKYHTRGQTPRMAWENPPTRLLPYLRVTFSQRSETRSPSVLALTSVDAETSPKRRIHRGRGGFLWSFTLVLVLCFTPLECAPRYVQSGSATTSTATVRIAFIVRKYASVCNERTTIRIHLNFLPYISFRTP